MDSAATLGKGLLDRYVVRANDVIYFKLVQNEKELDKPVEEGSFTPEFTHQFFGENENIFGYRGLTLKLYYTASSLERFISMEFRDKVTAKQSDGVEPDDALKIITKMMEGDFTANVDQFADAVRRDATFTPPGEKIHQFTIVDKENSKTRNFEVYKAGVTTPGFLAYHERMRTFLLWFIDGASYIDTDDERWDFFVLFEKLAPETTSESNGHASRLAFAGYTTVYRYYAYPLQVRPRISQVLILPPFQRKGLGAELLQSIYKTYLAQSDVLDIAVEDPSDNFVRLRDYVDCKNCRDLPVFSKENLNKGWSEEMGNEAQKKLKLSKKQTRRVYEILKFCQLDRSNEEAYRNYRLEVKNRLNAPFAKLNQSAQKSLGDNAMNTTDVRMEELKNLYNEVEEEYIETSGKLAAC